MNEIIWTLLQHKMAKLSFEVFFFTFMVKMQFSIGKHYVKEIIFIT